MKQSYMYIMTNKGNAVLYTGACDNLVNRVWQHKHKVVPGFTQKYNANKLVYYEIFEEIVEAIKREKQIKGGSRQKKIELINSPYAEPSFWLCPESLPAGRQGRLVRILDALAYQNDEVRNMSYKKGKS